MSLSNFTHILAKLFEKLNFLFQIELFWRSVIFVGVQKKAWLRVKLTLSETKIASSSTKIWPELQNAEERPR